MMFRRGHETPTTAPAWELAAPVNEAPAPPQDPAGACCPAWARVARVDRAEWPWQALHQLAHSRIPFSAERYAHIARCTDPEARRLLTVARHHRWIVHRDGIWIGQLTGESGHG